MGSKDTSSDDKSIGRDKMPLMNKTDSVRGSPLKQKEHPVLWWIGWIVLTILAFFVSCYLWTVVIARYVGPVSNPGVSVLWVVAVFGTWMLMLVPLIIVMYNKVDKAYDESRVKKEKKNRDFMATQFPVPFLEVERSRRLLPEKVRQMIRKMPRTMKNAHLVTLVFRDGTRLYNALVWDASEIVGVYDAKEYLINAQDAASAEPVDPVQLMPVDYDRWLRLGESEA